MSELRPWILVETLLEAGFTVCYIDSDELRRAEARGTAQRLKATKDEFLDLFEVPLGHGIKHYDVAVAVNPPPRVGGPIPPRTANRWTDWLVIGNSIVTIEIP